MAGGARPEASTRLAPITETPARSTYDVVIVGGAMIGSAVAWFLKHHVGFDGTVLIIERDTTYANCSTSHTNSCMRQQFSHPLNVRISQFGAEFVRNIKALAGPDDPDVHPVAFDAFGYLYLAADDAVAATLRANQAMQAELGAGTQILSPGQIKARYPFIAVDDVVCGSLNTVDEGYFDSGTLFDIFRRTARRAGVEYTRGEVVSIERTGDAVTGVTLGSGVRVGCGSLVNAAGPRAALVAAIAGFDLPVEPRKRFSFVFDAAERLPGDRMPLIIDPTGVHVRPEGTSFLTGCPPIPDLPVAPDDFAMDHDIFEERIWPVLAHRVPAFERLKVITRWAGHYAYNRLDQNVIVGPHPEVANFYFANGFSGHGLQQAPAVGRGLAEHIMFGGYRSLDLEPLGYDRVVERRPLLETAVI